MQDLSNLRKMVFTNHEDNIKLSKVNSQIIQIKYLNKLSACKTKPTKYF